MDEGTDCFDDDGDGYSENEGDCNDLDPTMSPDGTEVTNGIDDDCDGLIDEAGPFSDDDSDGFSEADGDCDDADAAVNPSATEAENGIDDDCDGLVDEDFIDRDGDGFSPPEDCNDANGWQNPAQAEVCDNLDNDCDGEVDEGCDATNAVSAPKSGCACDSRGSGGALGLFPVLLLALARRRTRENAPRLSTFC